MACLLELHGVSRSFGGLAAVADLHLKVEKGELLGLIGPNGAGKTTVFNVISGVIAPDRGRVVFKGQDVTRLAPHDIVRRGCSRTFQLPTLFGSFSVLDNVLLGTYVRRRYRALGAVLAPAEARGRDAEARDWALTLLASLKLETVRDERVRTLPHGHQKMVELAVALAAGGDLLLLDEPFAGLNAGEIDDMSAHIRRLAAQGITFIVVEHNMRALMRIVGRVCVLNFGRKIAEGAPRQISENPEVIRAYLGTRRHAADG